EPEYHGRTTREVLFAMAAQLRDENADVANVLASETVFEKGFDPLEGGFVADGHPYEVFDQWIEVLPTEQVVATEYPKAQAEWRRFLQRLPVRRSSLIYPTGRRPH